MEHKYSLQRYTGRNSRHTCPKCGRAHCFTLYVDGNNQPIASDVGRCEHRNSCGYEKTPKMYFEEHPDERRTFIKVRPHPKEEAKTDYIPFSLIQQSESVNNTLMDYLKDYFPMADLQSVAKAYHLGSTNKREIIFPQIDKSGKCRTGKVMQYGTDGHRIKGKTDAIDWLHARLMKKQGKTASDFHLKQCLFGEHLLSQRPNDIVCLVEGEKSAIICSLIFPQYVWLSCGGLYGLSKDRCQALTGRNVIVYADANATEEWGNKISLLSYCRSIKLSEWAKDEAKDSKRDIADLIMEERRPLEKPTTIGDIMQWMQELEIKKDVSHLIFDGMEVETIHGQIVAKANHYLSVPSKHGEKRIIKDDVIRTYERNFLKQCKIYKNKHISGRFRLFARVFHSSMRFDLDNSLKTLLDCLQMAGAITDDKLCFQIEAEKKIDKYHPRVEFAILEVNEQKTIF